MPGTPTHKMPISTSYEDESTFLATQSEPGETTKRSTPRSSIPGCWSEQEEQAKARRPATSHDQKLRTGNQVPVYQFREIWVPRTVRRAAGDFGLIWRQTSQALLC